MIGLVARVIAIGQPVAGDDGVGPAVLRAVEEHGVPPGVELHTVTEATAIMPLLETDALVILVDAVVGTAAGRVLELVAGDVERQGLTPLSTHGVGVMEALMLAGLLSPETVSPRIRLIGIGITPTRVGLDLALSPPVAAAVPHAARAILRLIEDRPRA